jgi:hypothetical protein
MSRTIWSSPVARRPGRLLRHELIGLLSLSPLATSLPPHCLLSSNRLMLKEMALQPPTDTLLSLRMYQTLQRFQTQPMMITIPPIYPSSYRAHNWATRITWVTMSAIHTSSSTLSSILLSNNALGLLDINLATGRKDPYQRTSFKQKLQL